VADSLWHFTCRHSARQIQRTALRPLLMPQPQHPATGLPRLLWLTALPAPDREATGLTSHTLRCDRMEFRYLALRTAGCVPWLASPFRELASPGWLAGIEAFPHDPENWFVTDRPVPARFDPSLAVTPVTARSTA